MTSPVMTVNLIVLTVAVPFLIAMILLYSFGSGSRRIGEWDRCVDPDVRLVGILRYLYEDHSYSFRFAGTGVIIGDNMAITVPQSIVVRDYAMFRRTMQQMFYLSSGSKYWYNEKCIMKIKDITFFPYSYENETWATGEIIVFRTEDNFPKCTPASKMLSISSAPVPADTDGSFSVWGWTDGLTRVYERYIESDFDPLAAGRVQSGAIFKDNNFWGFMRTSKAQSDAFYERQVVEGRMTNSTSPEERDRIRLYVNFAKIFDEFKHRYPEAKISLARGRAGEGCGTLCPGKRTSHMARAVEGKLKNGTDENGKEDKAQDKNSTKYNNENAENNNNTKV